MKKGFRGLSSLGAICLRRIIEAEIYRREGRCCDRLRRDLLELVAYYGLDSIYRIEAVDGISMDELEAEAEEEAEGAFHRYYNRERVD